MDVSAEQQLLMRLQESQRRLERASLSIQQGHWEVDMATLKHWASRSYLALLGLPEDSCECDTLDKVRGRIHPDDLEATDVAARRHFAGGPPCDVELRMRLKDASHRWFRVRPAGASARGGQCKHSRCPAAGAVFEPGEGGAVGRGRRSAELCYKHRGRAGAGERCASAGLEPGQRRGAAGFRSR